MHALTMPSSVRHFLYSRISLPFCLHSSLLAHLCVHAHVPAILPRHKQVPVSTLAPVPAHFSPLCFTAITPVTSAMRAAPVASAVPSMSATPAVRSLLATSAVPSMTECAISKHVGGKHKLALLAALLSAWCLIASPAAWADERDANNGSTSNGVAPASASTVIPVTTASPAANTNTAASMRMANNVVAAAANTANATSSAPVTPAAHVANATNATNVVAVNAPADANGVAALNANEPQHNDESNASLRSGQRLGTGGVNTNKHQGELANGGLSSPEGIIKWLLSTVVVLGLIFAFAYMLKRSRFVQRGGGGIVLENQLAVGPRERVVQLRVGQRQLLLGVTSNNISFLCDLSAPVAGHSQSTAKTDVADELDYDDEDALAPVNRVRKARRAGSEVPISAIAAASAAANAATSNEMSAIETNAMMQGFSARADDEDDLARAGLPPLYAEDEQAYTNLPEGTGIGASAEHSAALNLGLGERGAHGSLSKQEPQWQDENINAAVAARATNLARNGQVSQGARGRKVAAAASVAARGVGTVNALPDDTVLKARAARAKQSQQLEALARSQEQQQAGAGASAGASAITGAGAGAGIGSAGPVVRPAAASRSFADVLAQSYQQHPSGPESATGKQ